MNASIIRQRFLAALEAGASIAEATRLANDLSRTRRAPVDLPPPPQSLKDKLSSHPLDHDGDGNPGGSLPADKRGDDVASLRAEYEALTGKAPDRRWGESRLKKEIKKAKG